MKNDTLYVRHILDACEKIEQYVSVGHERFMAESHWQDAVIRQLEIIGEAAKNLSDTFRDEHPGIPWRRVCGLRDVLIHNYMGVDLDAVWEVTQTSLPGLKVEMQAILPETYS